LGAWWVSGIEVRGPQIISQALEDRMAHLALGRRRPVFDLGEQGRLDPDAAMRLL
jgi:hypothetical protein